VHCAPKASKDYYTAHGIQTNSVILQKFNNINIVTTGVYMYMKHTHFTIWILTGTVIGSLENNPSSSSIAMMSDAENWFDLIDNDPEFPFSFEEMLT